MELVAKLTLFGRAKAYIAIDRLFNFGTNSTEDFDCVLKRYRCGRDNDRSYRGVNTYAGRARSITAQFRLPQSTINAALSGLNSLADPRWRHMIRSEGNLKTKWDTVRQLYLTAYSADIKSGVARDYDASLERRNMRQNIRSWIWAWDLKRKIQTMNPRSWQTAYPTILVKTKISICQTMRLHLSLRYDPLVRNSTNPRSRRIWNC